MPSTTGRGGNRVRGLRQIVPEQISAGGIQSVQGAVIGADVDHAIHHSRRGEFFSVDLVAPGVGTDLVGAKADLRWRRSGRTHGHRPSRNRPRPSATAGEEFHASARRSNARGVSPLMASTAYMWPSSEPDIDHAPGHGRFGSPRCHLSSRARAGSPLAASRVCRLAIPGADIYDSVNYSWGGLYGAGCPVSPVQLRRCRRATRTRSRHLSQ